MIISGSSARERVSFSFVFLFIKEYRSIQYSTAVSLRINYQLLIKGREKIGIKNLKNLKGFMEIGDLY